MLRILFGLLVFLYAGSLTAQGLIVNEFSNGCSGKQEYIELLVVGDAASEVDLRGFIIDDNNGRGGEVCQGFGNDVAGSGVSAGYLWLDSLPVWEAVPTGSLILLYNGSDKNPSITAADDPEDLLVPDSVYVLPYSSPLLKACTTMPVAGNGADCRYFPCQDNTNQGGVARLGLKNSGDAVQVRTPDGTYYHGVAYGGKENMMNGGSDSLMVREGEGGQRAFALVDKDYLSVQDYRSYSLLAGCAEDSLQTPGSVNTSANSLWIRYLRRGEALNKTMITVRLMNGGEGKPEIQWEAPQQRSGKFLIYGIDGSKEVALAAIPAIADRTHYYISAQSRYNVYRFSYLNENGRKKYEKMLRNTFSEDFIKLNGLKTVAGGYEMRVRLPEDGNVSIKGYDITGRTLFGKTVFFEKGDSRIRLKGKPATNQVLVKLCWLSGCRTFRYLLN